MESNKAIHGNVYRTIYVLTDNNLSLGIYHNSSRRHNPLALFGRGDYLFGIRILVPQKEAAHV